MAANHLTEGQREALARRFPHIDFDACSAFFGDEQPAAGTFQVAGQGAFPAVRMANGVRWFYDKDQRPRGEPNARGDRPPMKAKAPARSMRHLMISHPEAIELLLVEGEGDGIAAASVGMHGVVIAGGTQALKSTAPAAADRRRNLFQGRAVRILYDADEAGRAGAREAAHALLAAGAARVAIVDAPFPAGVDLEDWLASYPTREAALGALLGLTGSVSWETDAAGISGEEGDEEAETEPLQVRRLTSADGHTYLAVSVYDEESKQMLLAVHAAGTAPAPSEPGSVSVRHDAGPNVGRGWELLERWALDGVTYTPSRGAGEAAGNAQIFEKHVLMLPAPPVDPGPSEELWVDVRKLLERWVALEPRAYDLLVAYIFMTYRLEDAEFESVPYLRIVGPSSSGKGRVLALMKNLVFRGLRLEPTASNLHRLVDYFGDATLVLDEFNLTALDSATKKQMINLLNQGSARDSMHARVEVDRNGQRKIQAFNIFGAKVMAGYAGDEHTALARRTIQIQMGAVPVPRHMKLRSLPPQVSHEAYELRRRLLGWRFKKFDLGPPPVDSERHWLLLDRADDSVIQAFDPLVEMVPASLPDALENILIEAAARARRTEQTRIESTENEALQTLARLWADDRGYPLAPGSTWPSHARLFPTSEIAEAQGYPNANPGILRRVIDHFREAGIESHTRAVTKDRIQRSGIVVIPDDPQVERAMRRANITWPPISYKPERPAL